MKNVREIFGLLATALSITFIVEAQRARLILSGRILPPAAVSEDSDDVEKLKLVVLGDSLAVGLGADSHSETPGSVVAQELASFIERPVQCHNFARIGATAGDLPRQVKMAKEVSPQIVIIIIGSNDIKSTMFPLSTCIKYLEESIRSLTDDGILVFFVPCADFSVVKSLKPPLRHILGYISRKYSRNQAASARRAGAVVINSTKIIKKFHKDQSLFSMDKFHPGSRGYKEIAMAILSDIILYVP